MKKNLKNLNEVIKTCNQSEYNITEDHALIDEDSVRGFETNDHIVLMYSKAIKEGLVDCIEILNKTENTYDTKFEEGNMLETYSKVITECLKYDIDIARNLSDIDKGTVRGFESETHIVITYKKLENNENINYINFLKKSLGRDEKNGRAIKGKKLGKARNIVDICSENEIDILNKRIFLEAFSTRGIDFGAYIIVRYREVTKGEYINSAVIGLIDKKEGAIYSLHESALMLDDKLSGMWNFFKEMKVLENWQAEVLKEYKSVKIDGNKMTIEGKGTFTVEK